MEIELTKATEDDIEFTFEWRNHPETRRYSYNKVKINKQDHIAWFHKTINNPEKCLLIAKLSGHPDNLIGVLRYDLAKYEALVSIYLSPHLHGKGFGTKILILGSDYVRQRYPQIQKLNAEIIAENKASIRTFEKAGYKHITGQNYQLVLHENTKSSLY